MKKSVITTILVSLFFLLWVKSTQAAAKFTLTPSSGTYSVGDQIKVTVGIDSGTDKVYTADLWMVYDASKLEFVDAAAVSSPAFPFTLGTKNYDNAAGTFNVLLGPLSSNTNESAVASGDLATLTFKAKATGTGTLSFTCVGGNTSDTNVFNQDLTDVVNCAGNQSGSYTIQAGTGGDSGAVSTPTKAPSSLPQTGSVSTTITLMVIGMVGIIASAFFLL